MSQYTNYNNNHYATHIIQSSVLFVFLSPGLVLFEPFLNYNIPTEQRNATTLLKIKIVVYFAFIFRLWQRPCHKQLWLISSKDIDAGARNDGQNAPRRFRYPFLHSALHHMHNNRAAKLPLKDAALKRFFFFFFSLPSYSWGKLSKCNQCQQIWEPACFIIVLIFLAVSLLAISGHTTQMHKVSD